MKTVFIFLLLLISGIASAQHIQDESYLDSDFWIFKAKLEACLLAKDSKAFENFLADRIFVGEDAWKESTYSKAEFLAYYELDERRSQSARETYRIMLKIMRFGFTQIEYKEQYNFPELFNELVFQAPSFYTKIEEEKELLILGTNVNIRAAPSKTAKIIHQASYETFPCDCYMATETTYQRKLGRGEIKGR